jgi:cytoskeleton protein RodZ
VLHERRSRLAENQSMMSSAIERDDVLPLAPRAGADLCAARERVGWSVQDMASALRIRRVYLEALEAGRIDELPGNAYALGFLRTYATALGLDPHEMTRRFKAEAGSVTQKTELTFPAPVPERGVPAGAVVLLGVVLAVGAYAGWYRLSGEGRLPAETTTAIPVRLAPLVQQAVPPSTPPPAAPAAVVAPAPQPVETATVEQVVPAPPPPAPTISPSSAAAAPVPPPPVPPAAGGPPDQPRILLRANADSWVQVRDRAGQVLLNRILHPGETWEVPAKSNLLLTTGNAGGTDLLVDGVASQVLGGYGAVRRDLPLDADLIKDGKLAPGQPMAGNTQLASPRANPQ